MSRWSPHGPPLEAYSRVTDPERFRPLHDIALALLGQLEAVFDVHRIESYGLDPELERAELARHSIRLVPQDRSAAPVTVVFTAFPGLAVRVAHVYVDVFPQCGCDACNETADGEAARLKQLLDDVTAGRFCERLLVAEAGDVWWESEFWSAVGRHSHRLLLEREGAARLLPREDASSLEWSSWPRRRDSNWSQRD